MATKTADKAQDYAVPNTNPDGNLITVTSTYTASAALSAGDVIQMLKIPQNCTVVDGYITYDALQSTTTVSVGDNSSATQYVSAQDASVAGLTRFTGVPNEYSADDTLIVTLGTAGMDASDSITLTVSYIMD